MADGKWIEGLDGGTRAVGAAQRVLALRFKAVLLRLPQAVHHADEDIEHVHQLRVSTRRAAAALRIFAELVPRKAFKTLRKQLRRIRRAAGAARDWDVFLDDIGQRLAAARSTHRPGLDLLLGIGHGQRIAAQESLAAAVEEPPLRLEAAIDDALSGLRLPEDSASDLTLRDLAVPQLSALLRALDLAASGDLSSYEHLHQIRILGKRLRYAMEVFASCFAAPFRDQHYVAVEEMQDILGLANDSHVAVQRLEALKKRVEKTQPNVWKRYRTGIDALIKTHRRRLLEQREHFEAWWRHWRASGGENNLVRLAAEAATSRDAPVLSRAD